MLAKFTPDIADIARNNEYQFFHALIIVFLVYCVISGIWSFTEYDVIRMPEWLFWIISILDLGCILTAGIYLYLIVLNRLVPKIDEKNGVLWFGSILYIIQVFLLANSIKRIIPKYAGFAARFGGDEFVLAWSPNGEKKVLKPDALPHEIEQLVQQECRQQNKPYILSCCYGYTTCTDPSVPLSNVLKQADGELYKKKQLFHSQMA